MTTLDFDKVMAWCDAVQRTTDMSQFTITGDVHRGVKAMRLDAKRYAQKQVETARNRRIAVMARKEAKGCNIIHAFFGKRDTQPTPPPMSATLVPYKYIQVAHDVLPIAV